MRERKWKLLFGYEGYGTENGNYLIENQMEDGMETRGIWGYVGEWTTEDFIVATIRIHSARLISVIQECLAFVGMVNVLTAEKLAATT